MALERKGKLNSAGVTFRRLTKQKVVNRPITAPEMRLASQKFGGPGYYRPSAVEVGGRKEKDHDKKLAKIFVKQLGSTGPGTYFKNAAHTLKRLGFSVDHFSGVTWQQLLEFVGWKSYAVIGNVSWKGGGLHAVLLEKLRWKTKTTTRLGKVEKVKVPASLCVCDPGFGAKLVDLPTDGPKPIYRPSSGAAGQFTGDILVL
jgi:hypothetical protein